MGSVKTDVHKGERQFRDLSLSDLNTVKWLILYRDKIDLYYGEKSDTFYDHAGNSKELNQELINTYAYLDELIEKCNFNKEQLALLNLLFIGYTFKDIEDTTKETTSRTAKRRFESICKTITEMNNRLWKIYVHKSYVESHFKSCSKCGENLPLTPYFYHRDSKGKDGYKNTCKECIK